jgi:hypothetical protein
MSLEAWGDEDPNDSCCMVHDCDHGHRPFEETCAEHSEWYECLDCGTWNDEEASCRCGS